MGPKEGGKKASRASHDRRSCSKTSDDSRRGSKSYLLVRIVAVAIALLIGWRVTWPLGSEERFTTMFVKHLPRDPSHADNDWAGNGTLKQVVDELGVSIEKFMDSVPALRNWMERQQATDSLIVERDLGDISEGLKPKHPVIIIPGVTNTPLILYESKKCASSWLRNRLWGSLSSSAHLFSSNSSCYLEHLNLDEDSGMDPPGIRLRAAQDLGDIETVYGLDMWKWMVDRLVGIGYDSNMVTAMTYDWRLAADDVETRDGYFSRLQLAIEFNRKFHKEKVAILTHSFGGNLLHHFLAWVEKTAGEGWTEKHVAVIGAIGVPHLGVPKALAAMLTGETKDTVGLGGWGVRMGDMFLPRKQRIRLLRSFGSIINMLPKGGNAIWGSMASTTDGDAADSYNSRCSKPSSETNEASFKHGAFLKMKWDNGTISELDVEASSRLLLEKVPEGVRDRIRRHGALKAGLDGFEGISSNFADVLTTPLPKAPSLRYLCLYGVDVPTERRYHYRECQGDSGGDDMGTDITIDASVETPHDHHCTSYGISHSNGDASVPLTSLGLMCRKWAEGGHLNPSGVKVTTVEFPHQPASAGSWNPAPRFDLRGGPEAADHLDIMGNERMLRLLVKAAAGKADEIEEVVTSDITKISEGLVIDAKGVHSIPPTTTCTADDKDKGSCANVDLQEPLAVKDEL